MCFVLSYENWYPIHGKPMRYVTYKTVYNPTYECYSYVAPFRGQSVHGNPEGKQNLNLPKCGSQTVFINRLQWYSVTFQLKEIIYTILDNLIVFLIVVSQSLTVLVC